MSLHDDLLQQARMLARKEPRRPKQASLRRAISTAYYALFHLFVDEATKRLVKGRNAADLRRCLARAFVHHEMMAVAKGFAGGTVSEKLKPAMSGVRPSHRLARCAGAFVDLQQARHEADYDLAKRYARQQALDLVEQAEIAFRDWSAVRNTPEADVFLVGLLAHGQMRV